MSLTLLITTKSKKAFSSKIAFATSKELSNKLSKNSGHSEASTISNGETFPHKLVSILL